MAGKLLTPENKGRQDGDVCGSKEDEAKRAARSPQKGEQPPKPPYMSLLDFGWLQEKEEEEAPQDDQASVLEDASSQGTVAKSSVCDLQEELWPPPGDNTEEHLEPRVSEVALIDSFGSNGKLMPRATTSLADSLDSGPLDHEGYYLCDEEALLKDSSASTGYFPCYRTYIEFPRYQPPSSEGPPGRAEWCPGTCQDASVQCDLSGEEGTAGGEKTGAEANNNSKEAKPWVAPGEISQGLHGGGGPRPPSGGRKLEGLGGRRPRPLGDGNQEVVKLRKSQEGPLKPHPAGSAIPRPSAKVGIAKEVPATGPWSTQLPISAAVTRKSSEKRKHRSCRLEETPELKPLLLHSPRSLPPSPEESLGPLNVCCYGTEGAGEHREAQLVKERGKETRLSTTLSSPLTSGTTTPSETHTYASRLSFHSIVSWMRKIFRRSPSPAEQPQPSTSQGTEAGRKPGPTWLSWFVSSRIYPQPL
ncbi:uncharacterized protein LOC128344390 isoform X2 [Hemicordylus capensis]|uniref:uncharacterized protein LOC128344390 isoform X2 n=1 Tax=Hemicordylus capensis TaxID=884348 RepID=UPI0023029491|nr:uncharacterized protein LOC128344390 isoform X2 [Hemicordylus capensis]